MKLKVCGMKFEANILDVSALKPDYLGFIFYDKSSRFFKGEIPKLSKDIKKVGVFVDSEIQTVMTAINKHGLDAVQLHGNETPDYCDSLKSQSVEVIKVFCISDEFDFSQLEPYEDHCDKYLFDTKGQLPGGNGYTFNWKLLSNYNATKPFFLSGGIGLSELNNINKFKNMEASKYCYAIDVNSKFEIKPGFKNITELEQFKNEL